jgi:hypothetical protein
MFSDSMMEKKIILNKLKDIEISILNAPNEALVYYFSGLYIGLGRSIDDFEFQDEIFNKSVDLREKRLKELRNFQY